MHTVSPDVASRHFMALLDVACGRIGQRWFLLPFDRAGAAAGSTAYRERVYCYELYHQLRRLSDTAQGTAAGAPAYVLSGEIDKAGLNAMSVGGREKPDLVWHVPGTPRNAVVIEVKALSRWSPSGVAKDLRTLSTFLSVPDRAYRCGALLVFGPEGGDDLQKRVRRAAHAASVESAPLQRARLLWHRAAGAALEDLGAIA